MGKIIVHLKLKFTESLIIFYLILSRALLLLCFRGWIHEASFNVLLHITFRQFSSSAPSARDERFLEPSKKVRINFLAGVSGSVRFVCWNTKQKKWKFMISFFVWNINIFLIFFFTSRCFFSFCNVNYRRFMISCCFSYIKFRHS